MGEIKTWQHSRKGKISGIELGGDDTWVDIEVREHPVYGITDSYYPGETIRVRRSFLTEVTA